MTAKRKPRTRTANRGQGSKWISKKKREAIYERDGHCLWCVTGACETLDHVIPRRLGGTNLSTNVFASCLRCNSRRGGQDVVAFAQVLALGESRPCNASHVVWVLNRIFTAVSRQVERRALG